MADEERTDADATPSSPDDKPVDTASDKPTATMTKEEHEAILARRLSGSGKRLKELEDKLAAEEAAKQAEAEAKAIAEGKVSEVLKTRETELKTLREQLKAKEEQVAAYEQKDTDRREALAKDNKRRLKGLPEELRDFPLPDDPELAAAQISALEAKVAPATSSAHGRLRVSPPAGGTGTVEQRIQQKQADLRDRYMGRR